MTTSVPEGRWIEVLCTGHPLMVHPGMRELMGEGPQLWLFNVGGDPAEIRWVYLQHFPFGRMAAWVLPADKHPLPSPLPHPAAPLKLSFCGEHDTMHTRYSQLRAILDTSPSFDTILEGIGRSWDWIAMMDDGINKALQEQRREEAYTAMRIIAKVIARFVPETDPVIHPLAAAIRDGLPNQPRETPFFVLGHGRISTEELDAARTFVMANGSDEDIRSMLSMFGACEQRIRDKARELGIDLEQLWVEEQ